MASTNIVHGQDSSNRYRRFDPPFGSPFYVQGQEQANHAIERFHILKACIQKKFTVVELPPQVSADLFKPTYKLDFRAYEEFALKPTDGMRLNRRAGNADGEGIWLWHVEAQHDLLNNNWKTSEGGILSCIDQGKDFFQPILCYHSESYTTGSKEWDALFKELKEKEFPKNIVPCMYFSTKTGCLACPFLHNDGSARAKRADILQYREETLMRPTSRQLRDYTKCLITSRAFDSMAARSQAAQLRFNIQAHCANPKCSKLWLRTYEDCPLQRCGQCKWTFYCSESCQKADWRRHKHEPCASIHEMIRNDELWSARGTRKGT